MLQWVLEVLSKKIFETIITFALLPVVYAITLKTYRAFRAKKYADKALAAVTRVADNGILREGSGFWLKEPVKRPAAASVNSPTGTIPILLVATLKGGVGKTTLSGSLAAHFATRWRQERQTPGTLKPVRVLLIDGDFQGSLTSMTVSEASRFNQPSKAAQLVSGDYRDGKLVGAVEHISQAGMQAPLSISVVPAYYDLAQAENRTQIEWLLPLQADGLWRKLLRLLKIPTAGAPDRTQDDLRFFLAETLSHPSVQERFDLVIIDAPPRLTALHAQALCASTHVLIPTILDGLSGDAVARYLDQIAIFKSKGSEPLNPTIQPIGVACTMIPAGTVRMDGAINVMRRRISAASLKCDVLDGCPIKQRPPYRDHAGELIAYAHTAHAQPYETLRDEVDALGDVVAAKLGASGRTWQRV